MTQPEIIVCCTSNVPAAILLSVGVPLLASINMPVGKMFEQVFEGEDVQLFFEQVGPLRTHPFQVLDGIG